MFQSTRPRRGAIQRLLGLVQAGNVSIHAPPEGRDLVEMHNPQTALQVSIHAPPEGRDLKVNDQSIFIQRFNPRAPGGARSTMRFKTLMLILFQSTRPRRGAISQYHLTYEDKTVSIHAPPEGRDWTD